MAENAKNAGPTLLKTLGGVAFLVGSVGLFIHRIPNKKYVEVIADKPRPAAPKPAQAVAAAAPKAKAAAPKAAAGAPVRPGQGAAALAKGAASLPLEASASQPPQSAEDWQDTCAAEIGILCNNVAEKRLPRCLHHYDEAIRKDCLKALLLLSNDPRAADL